MQQKEVSLLYDFIDQVNEKNIDSPKKYLEIHFNDHFYDCHKYDAYFQTMMTFAQNLYKNFIYASDAYSQEKNVIVYDIINEAIDGIVSQLTMFISNFLEDIRIDKKIPPGDTNIKADRKKQFNINNLYPLSLIESWSKFLSMIEFDIEQVIKIRNKIIAHTEIDNWAKLGWLSDVPCENDYAIVLIRIASLLYKMWSLSSPSMVYDKTTFNRGMNSLEHFITTFLPAQKHIVEWETIGSLRDLYKLKIIKK